MPLTEVEIEGVNCDRGIFDACEEAVKGKGDGIVSFDDAKKIHVAIKDGNRCTQSEIWTVRYCLLRYKFTQKAHDFIVEECKKLHMVKGPRLCNEPPTMTDPEETIDGYKCDKGILDECRNAVGDKDGTVSLAEAKQIYKKVKDGNVIKDYERWTVRYCLTEYKWTKEAQNWIVGEMKKFPPKASTGEAAAPKAKIEGVNCDRGIIDACEEAVKGDGKVFFDDAKNIYVQIKDGNTFTQSEIWTVRYCLLRFKFTQKAHDFIVEECKKLHKVKGPRLCDEPDSPPTKKQKIDPIEEVDGYKCDKGILDECRKAVKDGKVSLAEAKQIYKKVKDGNVITDSERWTVRYCLTEYKWTEEAQNWIVGEIEKFPPK